MARFMTISRGGAAGCALLLACGELAAQNPGGGASAGSSGSLLLEVLLGGFGIVFVVVMLLYVALSVLNNWDANSMPESEADSKTKAPERSEAQSAVTPSAVAPAAAVAPQPAPAVAASPPVAEPAATASRPGIGGELAALIAAAVAVALQGQRFRIRQIQQVNARPSSWRTLGRVNIHSSHQPFKRS